MSKEESNVKKTKTKFIVFYGMAVIAALVFSYMKSKYDFSGPQRTFYSIAAFLPTAVIGTLFLLKPQLHTEVFGANQNEALPKKQWFHRVLGIVLIIMAVSMVCGEYRIWVGTR